MILLRSVLFNVAYYVVTAVMVLAALPIFVFGTEGAAAWIIRSWASMGTFLLRVIVGTRVSIRGIENLPSGGVIIAAKHQSMFETFAFFPILDRAAYVMKRELARIPLWGWYARRAGMITVEREQGTAALRGLAIEVGKAIARNRQVIIFPEGTRRPPGAEADYKGGIAHLYRMTGAPVVPVALNSGLFWPRRQFRRYPGTLVIEFLPPIAPGLKSRDFMAKLQEAIETESNRLLAESGRTAPPPDRAAETDAPLKESSR